ncbi:acyltransferase family protein [Janthinobacterium lividum]|uniref:acyltransferase family protein n=1 Tax=Janthinobacterium lividum TaxID=29581 RepID=UPI0004469409|nr:acyltransferase [Janthinobacterium lividum]EZP41384.1 Fucose 4-O-acetylase [Janthinobacterium lividum]
MNSKFRYSLENFRGVAIIFVMFSHIASIQQMGKFGDFYYYIFADATNWFVFISGYLFYYLEVNKFNYMNYLSKKAMYVVLPYLILSVLPIAFWIYSSQHILYGLTPMKFVLWSLLSGGIAVAPMWFIPMIALFFLMTPIFRILSKTKLIYVLTAGALIFSMFSSRTVHNTNPLLSFLHFLGVYVLGIIAAKDAYIIDGLKESTKAKIISISLVIFFVLGFLFPGFKSLPPSFFSGLGIFNYIMAGKLALLIAIFLLFERFMQHKNNTLGYFAKISFGLFFIHGIMEAIFRRGARDIDFGSPVLRFSAEVGVVVFVSIAVVFVLKKILKKWSRYVIGC